MSIISEKTVTVELTFKVKYYEHPFIPGRTEPGSGLKLEPDCPAHFEVISALVDTEKNRQANKIYEPVTLTEHMQAVVREALEDEYL